MGLNSRWSERETTRPVPFIWGKIYRDIFAGSIGYIVSDKLAGSIVVLINQINYHVLRKCISDLIVPNIDEEVMPKILHTI